MSDISVIIPTYNGARFVADTIRSIASQTLPPKQIIVVDDCSTDDTREQVMASGADVTFVTNQQNNGICFSRNVGIDISTGRLIALCDQDDLWHPRKLETQAASFRAHPGLHLLFTNFTYQRGATLDEMDKFAHAPHGFWQDLAETSDDGTLLLRHPAIPKLLEFQPVFPSTVMFSREMIGTIGRFDASLGREQSEDLEFLFRCDLSCRLGALTMPLVTVRKHGGNYSSDTTQTTLSQIRILTHMLKTDHRYDRFRDMMNREIIERSIQAFDGAFAAGQMALCRDISRNIPLVHRSMKLHVKSIIASMPRHVADRLHKIVVAD
jgi:glycosyltransferase involved in cell wall biosynthesis